MIMTYEDFGDLIRGSWFAIGSAAGIGGSVISGTVDDSLSKLIYREGTKLAGSY